MSAIESTMSRRLATIVIAFSFMGLALSSSAQDNQTPAPSAKWEYSAWIGGLTSILQMKSNVVSPSEVTSAGTFSVSKAVVRVFAHPSVELDVIPPRDTDFSIPIMPSGSGITVARVKLVEYPDLLKEGSKVKNAFVTPSQTMAGIKSSRIGGSGGVGMGYTNFNILSGQGDKANVIVMTNVEGWGQAYRDAWSLGEEGEEVSSTWFMAGAEHEISGKARVGAFSFEGDPAYPLVFKFVKNKGYVYLCGKGAVSSSQGKIIKIGYEQTIDTWVQLARHKEQLKREAAVQAIGWLAKDQAQKEIAVPILLQALKDAIPEVRRNAAQSLGRIADDRAIEALTRLSDAKTEKDEWVQKVATEAIERIKKK